MATKFQPEPPDSDGSLPGMDRYIRRLYQNPDFPQLNKEGKVYLSLKTNNTGNSKRSPILRDDDLPHHLRKLFPAHGLHYATSPSYRAMNHRQVVEHKNSFFQKASSRTKDSAETAWSPKPDYPNYHVKGKDGSIGILTPCPWCNTNKFVTPDGKKGRQRKTIRTIAGFRCRIPLVGGLWSCHNPECIGDPNNPKLSGDDSDKVAKHTFCLYEDATWSKYPVEVRKRYREYLYTDVTKGKFGEIFVTEELCHEILHDDTIFSGLYFKMNSAYEVRLDQARRTFLDFLEASDIDRDDWPDFKETNFNKTFAPPTQKKLRDIFMLSFNRILPFLKRDLFSRAPGRCVKWDATFKYAKKTNNNPDSPEITGALNVLLGEHGHVMIWCFSDTEKDDVFQLLNYSLKKRCERIGQKAVDAVSFGYSDTCCDGVKNRKFHWFAQCWPSVTEAPFKDLLHGQKKVFDQTRGADHELHRSFTSDLKKCMLCYDEASVAQVLPLFDRESKVKLTPALAKEKMLASSKYTCRMLNYVPKIKALRDGITEAFEQLEARDAELESAKHEIGEGYLPYILTPIRGVRRGTKAEIENLLKHVNKGCYSDPLPPNEMSLPIDPYDALSELLRLRSTSQIESMNMLFNKMTNDVSRMNPELAQAKLWLRVSRFNLDKDKKLQKLLQIEKPRTMNWYIHEALFERHSGFTAFQQVKFPPKITDDYDELIIGMGYSKFKNKIDADWIRPKDVEIESQSPMPQPTTQSPMPVPTVQARKPAPSMLPVATVMAHRPTTNEASPVKAPLPQEVAFVSPSPFGKKPDMYGPQQNWNRKLAKLDCPTVLNTYLPDNKLLSHNQSAFFWSIVNSARRLHGPNMPPKQLYELCASTWNSEHFRSIEKGNPVGLGGLIRTSLVSKLLANKGRQIRSHQYPNKKPSPVATGCGRKRLFPGQVDKLSYRDAAPFLDIINGGKPNTLEKRRKTLHEYFEKNPEKKYIEM